MAVITPLPVHGADLSHHQASIDLQKAKDSGLDWVFHKCTQGLRFIDEDYAPRRDKSRKIKLPFGAYHFAETSDPVAQAKHFLKNAGIKPGDMRPMLDLEDTKGSSFSKMTRKARTDWVRLFVNVVFKETGVKPFIYTPFDLDETFDCPLWVARYSNVNAMPNVPAPWKTFTIRQFSNGEYGKPNSFPGLGHVDLNCWNGDPKRLLEIFTIPEPKPTKPPVVVKPPATKPPATKPPVKRKVATLKVGTANIQNFGPNLTQPQVEKDLGSVAGLVDLGLLQEIGEKKDHDSVKKVFDSKFSISDGGKEVVMVARDSVLKPVGAPHVIKIADGIPNTPTKKYHVTARYLIVQRYTWAVPTDLPDIMAFDIHYTNGAWPRDPSKQIKLEERRKLWNDCHREHGELALEAMSQGYIVIGGGDWNRGGLGISKFAPNQVWVCGGVRGLDHVYVMVPKGVKLTVPSAFRNVPLNSDHDLRVNGIILEKV